MTFPEEPELYEFETALNAAPQIPAAVHAPKPRRIWTAQFLYGSSYYSNKAFTTLNPLTFQMEIRSGALQFVSFVGMKIA